MNKSDFKPNPYFVITGRQKSWLEGQNKVLPVSCTVLKVADSFHEIDVDQYGRPLFDKLNTIAGSWDFVSHAIKTSAGVAVDLSEIRPKGTLGTGGMVSQGVTNFMSFYSQINEAVKRGSVYKNGAVVLYLDADHEDLIDFLEYPISNTPWAKRAVYIKDSLFDVCNTDKLTAVIDHLAKGTIFVAKKNWDEFGERLYSNVCCEILIRDRATCTLGHVNLGMISNIAQIPSSISSSMQDLIDLWLMSIKDQDNSGYYADPTDDPQIGLGFLGLGNMLANFNVTYLQFVQALEFRLGLSKDMGNSGLALDIVDGIIQGFKRATNIAKTHGINRAFTIAPTASCAFASKDINGYTTSPEISPPVADPDTKIIRRLSEVLENGGHQDYQYPPNIELAGIDVDWKLYDRLVIAWQTMMDSTSLAHSISYNWWLDKPVTVETFTDWYKSPLVTIYYRWDTSNKNADKTTISIEQTEQSTAFWEDEEDDAAIFDYGLYDDQTTEPVVCSVQTQNNDKNACKSCGG